MKRLLAATAAVAFLTAPVFAQTNDTISTEKGDAVNTEQHPTETKQILENAPEGSTVKSIDGIETVTNTGTVTTDSGTVLPEPNGTGGGKASQILTDQNKGASANSSTPSNGVVPGQDPE